MHYVIILAGGVGKRAGGSLPKQFQKLGGIPVVIRCLNSFVTAFPGCRFVVVMNSDFYSVWNQISGEYNLEEKFPDLLVVDGGRSRVASVRNGLEALASCTEIKSDDVVLIQDGARPLVGPEVILDTVANVATGIGSVPAVPLSDSIRYVDAKGSKVVDRSRFMAVQTPQTFLFGDILSAYRNVTDDSLFTDDASVAEAAGMKIILTKGDVRNIKLTNPVDFDLAEILIKNPAKNC